MNKIRFNLGLCFGLCLLLMSQVSIAGAVLTKPNHNGLSDRFLKDLGLKIVEKTPPVLHRGLNQPRSQFLYLGSRNSISTMRCAYVVEIVNPDLTCKKSKCEQFPRGFPMEKQGEPKLGGRALLVVGCTEPEVNPEVFLEYNTPEFSTNLIVLNEFRDGGDNSRLWEQKISKRDYYIEFFTEGSEGRLRWSPKKGFSWYETEP